MWSERSSLFERSLEFKFEKRSNGGRLQFLKAFELMKQLRRKPGEIIFIEIAKHEVITEKNMASSTRAGSLPTEGL